VKSFYAVYRAADQQGGKVMLYYAGMDGGELSLMTFLPLTAF